MYGICKQIIEYRSGEYVDFVRKRGRVTEVIFITEYISDQRRYTLKEHYGYGYVRYHLYTENGSETSANAIPQTEWISGDVTFDNNIMLAVPCIYGSSPMFEGRGENIFDSKTDSFDALDEAWSQWLDALTVSKGKTAGIMSIEACVEEMYGDSKEQSWKDEEVARLKAEQGIAAVDDDGIITESGGFAVEVG